MPAYHVVRSALINAPKDKIKASLMDLSQWPIWSPWMILDKDTTFTVNNAQGQVGAHYSWEGKIIGAGEMEIVGEDANSIELLLTFLKPFKSKARVSFNITEQSESTKIDWHMYGHLPFFMFFFKKMMQAMIGMDYMRGLGMFKEYMEEGKVSSKVHTDGIVELKGQKYIGIFNNCWLDTLGEVMRKDFTTLQDFCKENNIKIDKPAFTIYKTFDNIKQNTDFISCIPYEGDLPLPDSFVKGEIPTQQALKVTHTGTYIHLGNGWSAAMAYARHQKIKTKKIPMGIEIYVNTPENTSEDALITEIYLPLK